MKVLQNGFVVELNGPGAFSFDFKGVVSAGMIEIMCKSGQEGIELFLFCKVMVELEVVVEGLEQHLNIRNNILK